MEMWKFNHTSRCSTAPALRACAGQLLSRSFVVLLRKSIPQNRNLKTAAELNVRHQGKIVQTESEKTTPIGLVRYAQDFYDCAIAADRVVGIWYEAGL